MSEPLKYKQNPTGSEVYPENIQWSDLPVGWEALRYALAGVGEKNPNLEPPQIKEVPGISKFHAPYTTPTTIALPSDILNLAGLPEVIPNKLSNWDSRWAVGVIPHELTHYLNLHAPGVRSHEEASQFAQQRVNDLGPYNPMWAIPAANAKQNPFELLAERVAQPYVDAQEVGRRYAEQEKLKPSPQIVAPPPKKAIYDKIIS